MLAIGSLAEVAVHEAARRAHVIHLGPSLILPGLVNAHTHLDLTHIGPRPLETTAAATPAMAGDAESSPFVAWVEMVRQHRHADPHLIAQSVARGCALSLAAGVVAAGDIAGASAGMGGTGGVRSSLVPALAMARAGVAGVSFLEFFAIGRGLWSFQSWLGDLLAQADEPRLARAGVRLGLQPHAPNTVDARAYRYAAEYANARGLPICTHLAETPEETRFVGDGLGPQRRLLERLGLWTDDVLAHIGRGEHPITHALTHLAAHPRPLLVHLNDLGHTGPEATPESRERLIERLLASGATVAYCPRASAYFRAETHLGPHAYRELLRAGVPVALGTDSIINLPPDSAVLPIPQHNVEGRGMSIWDECRFLFQRDGTDPELLLAMATTAGAGALGIKEDLFVLKDGGSVAGLACVPLQEGKPAHTGKESLAAALTSPHPARLLLDRRGLHMPG